MENGPVEIVDFPINSMVDLSSWLWDSLPEGTAISRQDTVQQLSQLRRPGAELDAGREWDGPAPATPP